MVRVSVLVPLAAALAAAGPVSASDQRQAGVYCSPSGDVCYSTSQTRGFVTFRLTLAAKYFSRYRICVKPPRVAATCKSFPVRQTGQAYGGLVRWEKNFPNRGPGVYKVTWRLGTRALGPALTFRPPGQV
jgi:hypothetical protein